MPPAAALLSAGGRRRAVRYSRDAFASIDASAPSLDAPATLLVKQLSSGQQTIVTHGDGFGIDAFRFGTSALCQVSITLGNSGCSDTVTITAGGTSLTMGFGLTLP